MSSNIEDKIKDLGNRLTDAIVPLISKSNFSEICQKMSKIYKTLGKIRPLSIGKALMLMCDILPDIQKYSSLKKEVYIFSFELAIEKLTELAESKNKDIEEI